MRVSIIVIKKGRNLLNKGGKYVGLFFNHELLWFGYCYETYETTCLSPHNGLSTARQVHEVVNQDCPNVFVTHHSPKAYNIGYSFQCQTYVPSVHHLWHFFAKIQHFSPQFFKSRQNKTLTFSLLCCCLRWVYTELSRGPLFLFTSGLRPCVILMFLIAAYGNNSNLCLRCFCWKPPRRLSGVNQMRRGFRVENHFLIIFFISFRTSTYKFWPSPNYPILRPNAQVRPLKGNVFF